MPVYHYRAVTTTGDTVSGIEEAANALAAAERLSSRELLPIDVEEEKKKEPPFSQWIPRKVPQAVRLQALGHLSSLLDAGLSITVALSTIADQAENERLREILTDIAIQVQNGKTLSEAIQAYPEMFPDLHLNMILAGEESGNLPGVLNRLVDHVEREQALKKKVVEATIYPAVVLTIAAVVVTGLLVFVVPHFVKVLEETGVELPLPTRILMAISKGMRQLGLYLLGAIVVVCSFLPKLLKKPKVKFFRDRLILSVPVVKEVILKASIARFSRTLGTLIQSGLPLLPSIQMVGPVLGNLVLQRAVQRIHRSVEGGEDVTSPVKREPLFPPMVVQMIAVGEATGALDEMLGKIGDLYDKEVRAATKKLTLVLEPALIVGLGVVVGFVALALILPMLKAVTGLKH